MSYTDEPQRIAAATRAMCRELYGDGFDLHDAGAQDPDFRAGLERAAEAAIDAALDAPGEVERLLLESRTQQETIMHLEDSKAMFKGEVDRANAKLAAIRRHLESESARFARQVAEARSYASGLEAERRKIVVDKALVILDGAAP